MSPVTPEAMDRLLWHCARRAEALDYLRRLSWSNMSARTTRATLHFIGEMLNDYR